MTWEGLSPPYATIVADPPWEYEERRGWRKGMPSRSLPYSQMSLEEIHALPVEQLAAPGAHLYLWTTNRYLRDAFNVAESWGFVPTTTLVWCKSPRGLGPLGRYTVTTEFVVYGQAPKTFPPRRPTKVGALIRAAREQAGLTRSEVAFRVRDTRKSKLPYNWELNLSLPTEQDWQRLQELLPALAGVTRPVLPAPPVREPREVARVDTTWWEWPRGGEHSEKPAAFLDVVEQVSPGPYVELFARQPRLGWDSWGWGYEGMAS